MTNGYQITFFSHQDRRHKGKQIGDWLMHLVNELGLRGATLHAGGESFARGGRVHSAHFLSLPTSQSKYRSPSQQRKQPDCSIGSRRKAYTFFTSRLQSNLVS